MKIDKLLSHKIIDDILLRKKIKKYKQFYCTRIFDIFLNTDYNSTNDYDLLYKLNILSSDKFYIKNIVDKTDQNQHMLINYEDYIHPSSSFYVSIEISSKTLHQIHIDIKRLSSVYKLVNSTDISYIYYNILILISHNRFKLGYVQGMADFLVPLVYEYSKEDLHTCEAKAYYSYLEIIRKIEFNIINLQGNLILRLREELENIDPDLYSYFLNINMDFHIFSFRWFNCLFFREFKYSDYIRIFTVILAYRDINSFILYLAVSILTVLRQDIFNLDYNNLVLMIQDLSNKKWKDGDIDEILKRANILYKLSKKRTS